jgi:hypothetical protein
LFGHCLKIEMRRLKIIHPEKANTYVPITVVLSGRGARLRSWYS